MGLAQIVLERDPLGEFRITHIEFQDQVARARNPRRNREIKPVVLYLPMGAAKKYFRVSVLSRGIEVRRNRG